MEERPKAQHGEGRPEDQHRQDGQGGGASRGAGPLVKLDVCAGCQMVMFQS